MSEEKKLCEFCGINERFEDDLGEMYLWPDPEIETARACCKDCLNGEPGRKHQKRYGVGER